MIGYRLGKLIGEIENIKYSKNKRTAGGINLNIQYEYKYLSRVSKFRYKLHKLGWDEIDGYSPIGKYVHSEVKWSLFDDRGIPLIKNKNELVYNPCTCLLYGLGLISKAIENSKFYSKMQIIFDFCVNWLYKNGFEYDYNYPYYVNKRYFKKGWKSGMNYGLMLSFITRYYGITSDKKCFDIAQKCIDEMNKAIEEGGVLGDLKDLFREGEEYNIYEEYPTKPQTYTLNGFEYALLGLYDWSTIESPSHGQCKEMFDKGIITLKKLLPYYDIGGFTTYDLSYLIYNNRCPHVVPHYHSIHIMFNKVFYEITHDEEFFRLYKKWISYVN